MSLRHTCKLFAAFGLAFGLVILAGWDEIAIAGKKEDAEKYTNDLKTGKDAKVKVNALGELAKLGQIMKPFIKDAEPYMMKALEDKDATIRAAAAKAVGMIDPEPKDVVPLFLKMMKEDKDESVKEAAILGLGYMGPNAKDATPDLRKVVKDEDKKSKLNRAAVNSLRSINPKK